MMLACLAACHKDKEMDVKEAVVSNEEMTVTETQARFSWQVDFAGQFQTGVEVSQNENMADLRRVEASKEEDGYQAIVDSLTEGKKYYYRIVVWNKFGSYAKETKDFRTKEKTLYVIKASCLPTEGGLLTGAGQYEEGQYCTLKAICNEGYDFVNWTENGAQVSTQANYTFKVTQNRNLVANFAAQAPNTYTINVSVTPAGAGTVTGEGVYQQDQQCTVTATANEGYTFACWKENGNVVSSSANYPFPVMSNRTLVAHFTALQPNEYNINVSANPSNGGTVTGGGSYSQDQQCTVTANANEGYTFTNWTENGNVVTTNASYTFTVNVNRNLMANFEIKSYMVDVYANPSDGGSVSGGGTYNHGQSCMVSAEANSGFSFIYWTENDVVVSSNEDYPFTVIGDRNLVANFAAQIPNNYEIVVSANPSYGGTVTGGGTYQQGQQCIVTATPNDGYIFTNWTENGEIVWEDSNYAFSVDNNRDLVANFEMHGSADFAAWISVTVMMGDGSSPEGTTVSFYNHDPQAQQNYPVDPVTLDETGHYIWDEFYIGNYQVTIMKEGYETVVDEVGVWEDNYNMSYTMASSSGAPIGAINGVFSVSETQQVYFSKGNLQYIGSASTPYWKFADNQWDCLGYGYFGQYENIDLFGWGTSGYYYGNTYYLPWDYDNSNGSLYGPLGNYSLTGTFENADWGIYNPISNGGDQSHYWRTLTKEEWIYVFHTRTTVSGIRYAFAMIEGKCGMILLPDDWDISYYSLNDINTFNAQYNSNYIYYSEWMDNLEAHGAVFLPAAGYRDGHSIEQYHSYGYYWSSTSWNSNGAYGLYFRDGALSPQNANFRYYGRSVRLVCPVE